MNIMVYTHGAYIVLGIAATIWVTGTLSRRGRPFLARWWNNEVLASAWGHLLSVGVYLLHVGCLLLALRLGTQATTESEAIEVVATKLGIVLLALAVTHFLHVKAFWLMLRNPPREKPVVINGEIVGSGTAT
jgi:protein-S-isoprenylcysteine O-methyltransferase Ste14